MLQIIYENSFKKDIKKCQKRGYDIELFKDIVASLAAAEEPLHPKHRPHILSGNWNGYWECHIKSDWLLIYQITDTQLSLVRTGTHADLFK